MDTSRSDLKKVHVSRKTGPSHREKNCPTGFSEVKTEVSEPIPIPQQPSFRKVAPVTLRPRHGRVRTLAFSKDGLTSSMVSQLHGGRKQRFSADTSKLEVYEENLKGIRRQGRSRKYTHDLEVIIAELGHLHGGRNKIPTAELRAVYREYARTDYRNNHNREEPLGSFFS